MENYWPKVDVKVAEEKKKDPNAEAWENKMKLMAENFTPGRMEASEGRRLQRGLPLPRSRQDYRAHR